MNLKKLSIRYKPERFQVPVFVFTFIKEADQRINWYERSKIQI